jgi:hypothetical protein
MTEQLIRRIEADPNGEMVIKVFQDGYISIPPTRTVDVPLGVCPGLYEPVPMTLGANQRIEVVKGQEVIMRG